MDLRLLGFQVQEVRRAIKVHGLSCAQELQRAGFSVQELIVVGFRDARELKQAGFSAWELKDSGYRGARG